MDTAIAAMGNVGDLLRHWRKTRRLSQLELALEAEISTRHLSFVETGRSNPSREMVLVLASVLEVPLRERNALLQAAGFAPAYRETDLDEHEVAQVSRALDFILKSSEPYGAVVVDRAWNLRRMNDPMKQMVGWLLGADTALDGWNVMRATFDPGGFRPYIANFDTLAPELLRRLEREIAVEGDPRLRALLEEVRALPDVPASSHGLGPTLPIVPLVLEKDGFHLELFTMITTLGTPQDITLEELRIESYFPADEETDRTIRLLGEMLGGG